MLAQSVSSQYNMAGVRTEDSIREYEGKKCVSYAKIYESSGFSVWPGFPGIMIG